MTQETEILIELVSVLKQLDKMFNVKEGKRTKHFSKMLKLYNPGEILEYIKKKKGYDIQETLDHYKSILSDFELRFLANPQLKEEYLNVQIHLQKHFDEHGGYGVITPLVSKGGEEESIKDIYQVEPEDLQNLRTQIRYHELATQAIQDCKLMLSELQPMRVELYEAVANADKLNKEYDEFLCSMTIYGHLDDNAEDISVYNIPYGELKNFNQAARHYVG